jgi:AAA family ATP:ADP antiporter
MRFTKAASSLDDYTVKEKSFIFFMMICGFMMCAEAAITKSVSTSFFIDAYGPENYPYAWMASLPINFFIVFFYNKNIAHYGCTFIMGVALLFTIFFNLFCFYFIQSITPLPFLLYLWKEGFIMFMLHNLWSVIHSTISFEKAKYLYGIFFGIGGLGSVAGSLAVKMYAVSMGTVSLLLFTLPLYVLTFVCFKTGVAIRSEMKSHEPIFLKIEKGNMKYGLDLIKGSALLKFILFIVVAMQVSATLMEYQFGVIVKEGFETLDLRTAYMGKILSMVNCINVFIHFFGGYLLIKIMGVMAVHLMIPLTLLTALCMSFFGNRLTFMTLNYGLIKCYDYSLFGIVTALLYLPLTIEEKFQAKSIIDIFAYRGSKAIVSLLLFLLHGHKIDLRFFLIILFTLWTFIVHFKNRKKTYTSVLNGVSVIV